MKRTASIDLRIVPAIVAAALAAGCGSPSNQTAFARYCMDEAKTLVELEKCEREHERGRSGGVPTAALYHWVYGPRGVPIGTRIGGNPSFSRTAPSAPASSTVPGGFGSSARPVAS